MKPPPRLFSAVLIRHDDELSPETFRRDVLVREVCVLVYRYFAYWYIGVFSIANFGVDPAEDEPSLKFLGNRDSEH